MIILFLTRPPKFPELCTPAIMDTILKNLTDFRIRLVGDGPQCKWLTEVCIVNDH